MKYTIGLILVILSLVACGGDSGDAATPVAVTEKAVAADDTQTPVPDAPIRPSPTPYGGSIPAPSIVTATPTASSVAANGTGSTEKAQETVVPTSTPPTDGEAPEPALREDCGNFATYAEAQRFFIANGGPDNDPYEMDTDSDGVACNSPSDRGYESILFATVNEATAVPVATATATVPDRDCSDFATWQEAMDFFLSEGGPESDPHSLDADGDGVPCTALKNLEENPPTPTPTFPPAEPVEENVWNSEERAAELNSINWSAFAGNKYGRGVRLAAEGEVIWVHARDENGVPQKRREEIDCAPRFGNRLDAANPSFYIEAMSVWIWIEPTDGSVPFCAYVDRYYNWLASDPEPLPELRAAHQLPQANRLEPLVFTDAVNGPREHTLPPTDLYDLEATGLGSTVAVDDGAGTLECTPDKVPLAFWSREMGFEVAGRDEEELLARYAFPETRDAAEQEAFWQSYDWESKERWRSEGWFLALVGSGYYDDYGSNKHWENDVIYGEPHLASCWRVWNTEDLPAPRYCVECERRTNMERMAAGLP